MVEVFVDRAGEDDFPGETAVPKVVKVHAEVDLDSRMTGHALEHPGVAIAGHRLVAVREVAVVVVRADGQTAGHRGVELRWVEAPLLAGVATEYLFVQRAADLA